MSSSSRRAVLTFVALACCARSADETRVLLPEADGDAFASEVYPVLLRDCGSVACHGASQRFFRVVGPGRTRLSAAQGPLDPATAQEVLESYRRARAMLEPDSGAMPLLLRKPLALAAGGATHGGRDLYGRNVYSSQDDPGFRVLARWALGVPGSGESP